MIGTMCSFFLYPEAPRRCDPMQGVVEEDTGLIEVRRVVEDADLLAANHFVACHPIQSHHHTSSHDGGAGEDGWYMVVKASRRNLVTRQGGRSSSRADRLPHFSRCGRRCGGLGERILDVRQGDGISRVPKFAILVPRRTVQTIQQSTRCLPDWVAQREVQRSARWPRGGSQHRWQEVRGGQCTDRVR